MKKVLTILLLTILTITTLSLQAQSFDDVTNTEKVITDETSDMAQEINILKEELSTIKSEVNLLKKRTEWFTLKTEGSIKVTWGASIWARYDEDWIEDNNTNVNEIPYKFNGNTPIVNGFDFENNLKFSLNLGNKIVGSSTSKGDLGTIVDITLKIDSLGISDIQPEGSWYVVQGKDDLDNTTDIYFPRYERGDSNIIFGNYQIALEQARVKNILGSGFFVNYEDVKQVDKYYGIEAGIDVMTLNHDYFNNGFYADSTGDYQAASLYFSFDDDKYKAESKVSEGAKLWSKDMLKIGMDERYNQNPHGISLGYDKDITEGFNLFFELGAASKDAFDPLYHEDKSIDYGFFARIEPKFHLKNKFTFHPKLNVSFAFQTNTTEDLGWEFSTFQTGLSIPLFVNLSTGPDDYLRLEANWNMNVNIVTSQFTNYISFLPEFSILKNKLFFSLPIFYSFKNVGGEALPAAGHEDIGWWSQIFDDHYFNLGFQLGFDSKELFGSMFQFKVTNSIYFTYFLEKQHPYYVGDTLYSFYSDNDLSDGEYYFYEIIRNDFIFKDIGPEKLSFYVEFGVGYAKNARLVTESSIEKIRYEYDRQTGTTTDLYAGEPSEYYGDWYTRSTHPSTVLSIQTGIVIDVLKKLSIGLSVDSPKLAISTDTPNVIGNQQTYAIIKLWSEITF